MTGLLWQVVVVDEVQAAMEVAELWEIKQLKSEVIIYIKAKIATWEVVEVEAIEEDKEERMAAVEAGVALPTALCLQLQLTLLKLMKGMGR
jgi:hypothetical protein